ncbi:hypothetical protein CEP51_001422 [Fusarium floridanum]|uniref:DUF1996 domain-containing protein n=1 Tax=Fusarium floridanum TaxID=1325733 RepID=A0A428SH49_9HYPO|nr:hypothetical protein CEP51_001422 [Fusarium floridanum]
MLKSIVAVTAGLIGGAHAFWRMECPGRVGLARLDPIIDPGKISMHAHSIHGSSGFSDTSSTEELLNGDCTSCRVTQDKSSYWHPAMYFQDGETGEFEIVPQVGGMLAYYLLYGDNVTAFPPDFRMLSGTNSRRTYTAGDPSKPDPEKSTWQALGETDQDTLAQRALGFNCLNYARDPEGTLYRHYMPDKQYLDANCKDGLRLEIMFPSCWKGGDAVDSANHKDHVAFPDLVMTGTCPEGYPVRLPSLMYEVIWNTNAFADRSGRFVLANGDTTGYGYHADFITGWDEDFLQQAIEICTSDSGLIGDCPIFDVISESVATSCKMNLPDSLAKEDVLGPMKQLPGGNQVSYGDGSDGGASTDPGPTGDASVPTLTYHAGDRPENSASPLPGQVFKEKAAAYEASAPAPAPTVVTTTNVPIVVTSILPSFSSLFTSETTLIQSIQPAQSIQSSQSIPDADGSVGAEFVESSIAQAPESVPTSGPPPVPTTTPAPEVVPTTDTKSYWSTQYITNGKLVSKILWDEKLVYVTELEAETVVVTVTSTAVVTPTAPAARRRRRGAHLHSHGRRHL